MKKILECPRCESKDINLWESGDYLTVHHQSKDATEDDVSFNEVSCGCTCNVCGKQFERDGVINE